MHLLDGAWAWASSRHGIWKNLNYSSGASVPVYFRAVSTVVFGHTKISTFCHMGASSIRAREAERQRAATSRLHHLSRAQGATSPRRLEKVRGPRVRLRVKLKRQGTFKTALSLGPMTNNKWLTMADACASPCVHVDLVAQGRAGRECHTGTGNGSPWLHGPLHAA